MKSVVVSDLHLGSKYALSEDFAKFVRGLEPGAELILNGDSVDKRHKVLSARDIAVLDLLKSESESRKIVWVRGNHDEGFDLGECGLHVEPVSYSIGKRLYITHGYDFDNIMPKN